jgi:hypothetical protein
LYANTTKEPGLGLAFWETLLPFPANGLLRHKLVYCYAMVPRTSLRCVSVLVIAFFLSWTGGTSPLSFSAFAAGKDRKEKKEKADPREMQAREAYGAGNYKDALAIFTKLFAETLHPTYLRNIGRCYQNLNDPDHAISSFHEYRCTCPRKPAASCRSW